MKTFFQFMEDMGMSDQQFGKDQGEGLSETSLNTVFEPVISTKPGGSGLGLAITRRLALSIEGELIVQSTGLKGTVFLLTL